MVDNLHRTWYKKIGPANDGALKFPTKRRSQQMITQMRIFSETKIQGEWRADTAQTYEADEANRFGWVAARMKSVDHPQDYALFGLLVDGVRMSWPWSFHERGFPEDASPEVQSLCKSWGVDGYGHSHLSLQELSELATTLMLDTRPEAGSLLASLMQLIRSVSTAHELRVDPEDRRVVLWFDS